jgi:hypothetical protein
MKIFDTVYKMIIELLKYSLVKLGVTTMNELWRLWAKAIGEKEGTTDREADKIAMIRTVIVLVNFSTCFFIIAGNIHNW